MKKISVILTICLLLLCVTTASAANSNSNNNKRYFIYFKDKVNYPIIQASGGKVKHEFKSIPALLVDMPTKGLEKIQKNRNIEYVEEDGTWSATSQVMPWGVQQIRADDVQQFGVVGNGIKVGILDSGISKHEDLRVAGGWNFINNTALYGDDFGHGTHVAGTVAALNNTIGVIGVAPDVQLYSLKVLDAQGNTSWSNVAKALDWGITNKIQVVNMSFGGSKGSKTVEKMINRAYQSGMLLVASAGNNGNKSTVNYPANYTNVIAVGAIDIKNNLANFSSTGAKVELVAPGVDILSTYLGDTYSQMSGTSMASPHVTGTAALIWSQNHKLTNIQVRSLLDKNAIDLGLQGRDNSFGYGLVNAYTP